MMKRFYQKIALHYITHIDDKKYLDYLNKAYQAKATAFTINNYAHHLAGENMVSKKNPYKSLNAFIRYK